MLGDVKSFFTKSSVGEVGVGLSIGAAFTNVMSEATEMGRGLIGGDVEYAGLVQAVIALLSVAFFSIVLVVKPLAKLKAMADRTQVDLVARAAGEEATLTPPLAEEGVDDGLIADTSADPTVDLTADAAAQEAIGDEPAVGEADERSGDLFATTDGTGAEATAGGRAADTADADAVDAPLEPTPGVAVDDLPVTAMSASPAPSASYSWTDSPDGSRLERLSTTDAGGGAPDATTSTATGETEVAAAAGGAAADTTGGGPSADEVIDVRKGNLLTTDGDAAGGADAAATATSPAATSSPATAAAPAVAEAPTVLRNTSPHSHQVTKVCPYCAFDIPAVASRCGYCTADLTDAQRVAGVVLVDQQP